VFNVISGSMEPTYSVGDLLYVKTVDPDSVRVGDPITFVLNEDLVVATHRVVAVDAQNRLFTTKGDANETEDANPVHFNNLIGVPVFAIPLLGYVSAYIQSPPGMYVAIGFGVLLLAAVFLPDMITKDKKKQKEEIAK
jgi:signal peptidase